MSRLVKGTSFVGHKIEDADPSNFPSERNNKSLVPDGNSLSAAAGHGYVFRYSDVTRLRGKTVVHL